jgi:hypothetical protein
LSAEDQKQMDALMAKQKAGAITPAEQKQLDELMKKSGKPAGSG